MYDTLVTEAEGDRSSRDITEAHLQPIVGEPFGNLVTTLRLDLRGQMGAVES